LSDFGQNFDPAPFEPNDTALCGLSLGDITVSEEKPEPVNCDDYVDDRWKFSKSLSANQMSEIKIVLESVPLWDGIG